MSPSNKQMIKEQGMKHSILNPKTRMKEKQCSLWTGRGKNWIYLGRMGVDATLSSTKVAESLVRAF